LRIDGVKVYKVDSENLPPAWVTVPVVINELGVEFNAKMVAGVVGYSVSASGKKLENGEIELDTLKPETSWWMLEVPDGME
jgi:hypothetical protein